MKIYLAGYQWPYVFDYVHEATTHRRALVSFVYCSPWFNTLSVLEEYDVMIDSSAFSKNTTHHGVNNRVDIYRYMDFLETIDYSLYPNYVVMDDIESWRVTQQNQIIMENRGLNPIPVWHYGEPEEILADYCQSYDYVGIGGTVGIRAKLPLSRQLIEILERNNPDKKKIHLFGFTSHKGMTILKDHIHSVDSNKWIIRSGFRETFDIDGRNIKTYRGKYSDKNRWWFAIENINATKAFEDRLNG